jgi:hypothetical protein
MPEEKKEPRHPEVTFLPPLQMVLSFFDKKARERTLKKQEAEKKKESDEKTVTKLIEKLSEKDE